MTRSITFAKTKNADGVWINRETGVEIYRTWQGYMIRRPFLGSMVDGVTFHQGSGGWWTISGDPSATLNQARRVAAEAAKRIRDDIAEAYDEAVTANAAHDFYKAWDAAADAAKAYRQAAVAQECVSRGDFRRALSWLQAACEHEEMDRAYAEANDTPTPDTAELTRTALADALQAVADRLGRSGHPTAAAHMIHTVQDMYGINLRDMDGVIYVYDEAGQPVEYVPESGLLVATPYDTISRGDVLLGAAQTAAEHEAMAAQWTREQSPITDRPGAPTALCLRATGAHVGHMRAVSDECRDEAEPDDTNARQVAENTRRTGYAVGGPLNSDGTYATWGLPY